MLTVHAVFICVFAVSAVVRAVTTAICCHVVPLVLATRARATWFAMGFGVALCVVVIAYLINAGFTCTW